MKWINIHDELPVPYQCVLVIDSDQNYFDAEFIKNEETGNYWLDKNYNSIPNVTHWMELPPIPGEDFEIIKKVKDLIKAIHQYEVIPFIYETWGEECEKEFNDLVKEIEKDLKD